MIPTMLHYYINKNIIAIQLLILTFNFKFIVYDRLQNYELVFLQPLIKKNLKLHLQTYLNISNNHVSTHIT